jgi:hypothetical protein
MRNPHHDPNRIRSFFSARMLALPFNWMCGRVVFGGAMKYAVATEEG